MKKGKVIQFREGLKNFLVEKMIWRINNGELDDNIKKFLNGDTLIINMEVELISNDIIFMRELIGIRTTATVRKKLHRMWGKNE